MTHNKSKKMSSFLKAGFLFVLIQCCISAPAGTQQDTLYSKFVADMTRNNCTLPGQIPISLGANEITLEAPLQICNMPEYLKFNREAKILCKEIFVLLKDISCSPQYTVLPNIHVPLLADVCEDFASHKAVLPPQGLLGHLSDSFNCKLMCAEEFEDSCKVLLWSFLVQSQMKVTATVEAGKTTKSSPVTETKPTQKQQPNPQTEISNDGASQIKIDDSANQALIVQKPNELLNALDEKEKPVDNNAQDMLTEPKVEPEIQRHNENLNVLDSKQSEELGAQNALIKDTTDGKVQSNSINELAVEDGKTETESKTTLKIKNVIPIETTLNISPKKSKDQENPNPNLESNNQQNELPMEPKGQISTAHFADTELQSKSSTVPKENSVISSKAEENDPKEEDAKNQESIQLATGVSDSQMESKNTIPQDNVNSGIISETNQKDEITGEKVDDSGAFLAGKSPVTPAKEAIPTAESISVSVGNPENIPSPTSVPSMVMTPSLEKMEDEIPLTNDKDADHYNDLDNAEGDLDGEYSKQDYSDNAMYEPTKSKESISEAPKSIDIPKEPVVPQTNEIDGFNGLSSRDSFGRGSDEIQVLAAFPDQEDSHFFFYFLSIVLILMAGYLIFHNKQKIIALIVEGRHERRRRSHGLGYKKLETK